MSNEAPQGLKNAELQKYYDRLFAMHGSEGWTEFMADVTLIEEDLNRLDKSKGADDRLFRLGQLEMARWLLSRKETVEAAYNHMLDEQGDEAPEPTGGNAKVVA